MDFQPTEEQRALRAGLREVLAARFGQDALRAAVAAAEAGAPVVDRRLWRELGDTGFFALGLPEEAGGVGLGLPEAVLLFEEAGRALLPGPLVATWLAAGTVPGAAEGRVLVTAYDLGDGLVTYPAEADAVLGGSGPAAVAAGRPAVAAGPAASVDPLTPLGRAARSEGTAEAPGTAGSVGTAGTAGTPGSAGSAGTARPAAAGPGGAGGPGEPAPYRREGALLTAALQVGSALRTTELAVAYAGRREQFGRPIGAFQAVKHLCAQMLVRAELARTAVYAAAVTGDPVETAAAKLLADEAAVRGARDCLQVHGGMGFTWEAEVHLHLKRAWLRAEQWLTAAEAEEALAADLTES
ncbi:acyl-CoA dehydrogenase family protein [Streptomyces antimicrobicus]|uniref:Acyl-CoA/acyl-ACP dehydrogenase n=1 Tax=Streptomyces antimicrobicus TaxID=2883108 RepID=A0ABS8B131_9ACTN|nr:acyl-CoA dehydrogenase family protein [Streptomyces antimicrobicus]MCB5178310.1 acyl-CoA/acyl-ACP dehydrogenase [Streptomyces antimicrobicus]